jgi:succinate-semialdehyde dehydrogenase/glutarate-semialdehyde dehydrogenase
MTSRKKAPPPSPVTLLNLLDVEHGTSLRTQSNAEFSRAFAARLEAIVVGPGLDEATDVGPLVNEPTRSKVAELVSSAAADGGKVVTGGRAPDRRGYFYQPTVIDQVPSDAGILHTEIFGPVAPVVRFTEQDDATGDTSRP